LIQAHWKIGNSAMLQERFVQSLAN